MRRVGSLSSRSDARRFFAFLAIQKVPAQIVEDSGEWSIWVRNEDQIEFARAEFAAFVTNPADKKFAGIVVEESRTPDGGETTEAERAARRQQVTQRERQPGMVVERRRVSDDQEEWQRPEIRLIPLVVTLCSLSFW